VVVQSLEFFGEFCVELSESFDDPCELCEEFPDEFEESFDPFDEFESFELPELSEPELDPELEPELLCPDARAGLATSAHRATATTATATTRGRMPCPSTPPAPFWRTRGARRPRVPFG
jgi:hypothetical protein